MKDPGQHPADTGRPAPADEAQLALRPPMGWNSWNAFRCRGLSAKAVLQSAHALVASGMRDAGYQYVVVDDCWQAPRRDRSGRLQADPARFPDGIAAVADEIHLLGLKFGLYSVPGSTTCAQQWDAYEATGIGSLGRERLDAETFAAWGVDYLKYDWCRADVNDGLRVREAYALMRSELDRLGRPVVYSISEYGEFQPWRWAPGIAHLWRTTQDLQPRWDSILATLDRQVGIERYARPGGWNDPDMLQVGNGTLSLGESRAHFALWALLNAPLMAGNDLRTMTAEVRDLLCNRELIAINQDWAGTQGRLVKTAGDTQVWSKPMSDGGAAVVLLNRGEPSASITIDAGVLGLTGTGYRVAEVWTGHQDGFDGELSRTVAGHEAVILRFRER